MIKLAGALLIVFAGTAIGFYQSSLLAARPKQIRMLIQALLRLESEISYGRTPLPEAFERMARQTVEPLSTIFRQAGLKLAGQSELTAQESWQQAIDSHWGRTAMRQAELDCMRQLGYTLGVSAGDDQIKHLRLAVHQLQAEEDHAREERGRYEKMWKSLGVLAGTLVAILMY